MTKLASRNRPTRLLTANAEESAAPNTDLLATENYRTIDLKFARSTGLIGTKFTIEIAIHDDCPDKVFRRQCAIFSC